MKTLFCALAVHGCSAMRNNKVAGASSAAHVMSTIGSMLQQRGYSGEVVESLRALAGRRETPGLDDSLKGILDSVVADLEAEVESKIKLGHTSTQTALTGAIGEVQAHTSEALSEKSKADGADEAWFNCVRVEKAKLAEAEAAAEALAESRSNMIEPCQLQADRTPFSAEIDPAGFECDHSLAGDCDAKIQEYSTRINGMLSGVEADLQGASALYNEAKEACDAAKADVVEKENTHNGALAAFSTQKGECLENHETRQISICLFGSTLQRKCEKVGSFRSLTEQVLAEGGGAHSQPDRLGEWKTVAVTKCMIQKVAAGVALDGTSLSTCETSVDYERDVGPLDMYESTLVEQTSPENFSCTETTITFTGETWEVPTGSDAHSSEYTVVPFHPAFDVSDPSAPFGFCEAPAPAPAQACPPPGNFNLPVKGCGTPCLNSNLPYDTLAEAWQACGTVQECGFILEWTNKKYYLRRASDPDYAATAGYPMMTMRYDAAACGGR